MKFDLQRYFVLAAFDLRENNFWIYVQQVFEKIQFAEIGIAFGIQRLSRAQIRHQHAARALCNQHGSVQRVQQREHNPR